MIIEVHPRLLEQAGSTDQALLDRLERVYDDVRVSFDFRSIQGSWHPVAERWDVRYEASEMSGADEDMCQLLCLPGTAG